MTESIEAQLNVMRARIDRRLAQIAPSLPQDGSLNTVIRYSLLAPAKRLRPLLTLLTAKSLGGDEQGALELACAIEMIHTASLIIDDLPSMDDAKYRRGRQTSHRRFGEDQSILAGFALMNQAFDLVSRAEMLSAETRLAMIRLMTRAIGATGIIAGQARDLGVDAGAADSSAASIQETYSLKTGALFVVAAEAGGLVAGLEDLELRPIRLFARNLGVAYQTRDDLIDCQSTVGEAGKDVGADVTKTTLVSLLGETGASSANRRFVEAAVDALRPFGSKASALVQLANMMVAESPAEGRVAQFQH